MYVCVCMHMYKHTHTHTHTQVLVDVWPEAQLKGPYTGLTVEAEEEPFEEELVANALSEMRKREALGLLSGADTKAKVCVCIVCV